VAGARAALARALLSPREGDPPAGIGEVIASRARLVDAFEAERRRIERDLHDGAQAHLVALSMRIGLAKRAYDSDPAAARRLLDDAQTQAEAALAELRHVVRGIHPPILTDRGLTGAVRALAASSGLEVAVSVAGLAHDDSALGGSPVDDSPVDDSSLSAGPDPDAVTGPDDKPTAASSSPGPDRGPRAPAAVEAAAYFAVAEALTNAAKHSGATRATVALSREPAALRVRVADEGRGGAEAGEGGGSGLTGLRRRVAALDGTVRLTSPVGGPTVIEVELPCVW
ncbi:histidine kinase, partial [Streptomyces sp. SR27]|uniref:sensor histidine kinase n=1 Tax=Streptomyces sp. SR27 TaxID=3076630 RepID=UPI00295BDB01